MEASIPMVFDLLTLLADSFEIYFKNGRLMAFFAVLFISLHSFLYLFNTFCVTPWITDLIMNQTFQLALATPGTPGFTKSLIGMQKDFKIFVAIELLLLLISSIASLLFSISITYASALIHGGKMISIKDVVSRTVRSFKKPLITSFYITVFVFGYFTLCFLALLPFWSIPGVTGYQLGPSVSTIILFGIPALIFLSYLSVVWNLSFVISVLEGKFGIEALGKAARIVKGMKLQGFILNLLLNVLSLTLILCSLMYLVLNQHEPIRTVIALVMMSFVSMATMFELTVHTVLYYRCKKNHGEEIELQGADAEYTKLSDVQLINESIP